MIGYTYKTASYNFHFMGKYYRFLILIAIVFPLSLLLLVADNKKEDSFAGEISKCSLAATRLRFSCYRSTIEKYYHSNLAGLLSEVKDNKNLKLDSAVSEGGEVTYGTFGTSCHTFYHAVGDFIATNSPGDDIKSSLEYCPSTCTAGCTMGLYKRTALQNNFSTPLLKRFYNICRENERNQCTHEIGHLLHDKYFYSILKLLDEISYKKYGLKQPVEYKYVTETKTDLNAPFEECKDIVPENKWAQCFTGIGHNLFFFSEFSDGGYKPIFDECNKIPDTNKKNCFSFLVYRIGINEGATRFLSNKPDLGKEVCDNVIALTGQKSLESHCYLGIGGGIGLFADSEFTSLKVTEENISQIKERLVNFANLCDEVKGGFNEYCFRGLWGTKFKKLYQDLNVYHEGLERAIEKIDAGDDFEVVG